MNIIELLNTLDENRISRIIVTQLAKSATSIGAIMKNRKEHFQKRIFIIKLDFVLLSLMFLSPKHIVYWLMIFLYSQGFYKIE